MSSNPEKQSEPTATEQPRKLSFLRLMLTAFAAAFGVQSNKNREADFAQKSIVPYIAAGVIFTLCFMMTLVFIVAMVV
ncbi:DUF2970 domain-containing protein [Teredinibacter purpureus]|uniref:DUF2970 domain-containing protein n=1 Tax=Teredinibacter purpureus TaxID=2731756 RepID=UPI0005F863D7|nr:DUF2970 domain-containing protein [Teredinibacter purpureus]